MSNPKNKKASALGDESRKERTITTRSLVLATCVTLLLFGLLPLSEYVRGDEWIVREADWIDVPKPPQKKPALEQRLEEKRRNAMAYSLWFLTASARIRAALASVSGLNDLVALRLSRFSAR